MTTSILDTSVSMLQSYSDTQPQPIQLLTYLNDDSYKHAVEKIRATTDSNQRKALKASLPAIHVSGLFSGRGEANLIQHSGLIAIDIDRKDNTHLPVFTQVKTMLIQLPEVAYCALSVSGNGYWAILPISNPEKHKQHFAALQLMLTKLNIRIDHAPSNVASLRGYSYDPDAYFNHQAQTFKQVYEAPQMIKARHACVGKGYGLDVFEDFNERGDIEWLLQKHGWTYQHTKGSRDRYSRPGKTSGISADYCRERKVFYVFSSDPATGLSSAAKGFSHTGLLSEWECGADYKLCRKLLIQMGYGQNIN